MSSNWMWKPSSWGHRWDDKKWMKRIAVGTGENGSGSVDGEENVALAVAIVDAAGVQITSFGGGAGLTDAQLRATPVPVSGTVTTGGLTDAQLRAAVVPVSLASTTVTGTVAISATALPLPATAATAALQTQPGVDIGDVTVNNAAGAAAVNIQDGGNTITVDGTVTANPATGQGKTLLFASVAQGAAGTTTLVAADATKKVKVVSYAVVLDVAGTVKFTDGTDDLSGAMPVSATGGIGIAGAPDAHLLETAAVNRPLNVVSTVGKAFGHVAYFLEA